MIDNRRARSCDLCRYARTQNCTQDAAELTVVTPLRAPPYGENERCIAGDRMLIGCWDVRQIATG